jgi:hypothetical protein
LYLFLDLTSIQFFSLLFSFLKLTEEASSLF